MDGFESFNSMDDSWSMKNLSWSGNSTGLYQAAFTNNSTFGVINEFKFLAARSIRTSTIILAAFNTVSAFATAAGIFFDSYMTAKRSYPPGKGRVNVFTCVRGPELYPFFLSLGITIQGIIFAVSQSRGLEGLFIPGCTLISQIVWPAVFIVPYIQLVFGLEITFRALRKRAFPRRAKWDVSICLAIISTLLLITGLVSIFIRPPSFCFASLFWFVARWAEGGFVLLLGIAIILAICAVVLSLRLTRCTTIEPTQRVGASRMVYYLLLAVVSNALMAPFFIYLTFSNSGDGTGLTLSMISTVVANVTGLMTGGLHLFLRSNTISTIGPKYKLAEDERQKLKYQIRMRGPSEMDFNGHMMQPVSGPQALQKSESQESLVNRGRDDDAERGNNPGYEVSPQLIQSSTNPLASNAVFVPMDVLRAPEPAQVPSSFSPSNIHGRRPSVSYKLFPNKDQSNANSVTLPSTTYSPNTNTNQNAWPLPDLSQTLMPPPTFQFSGSRHRRDSSLASSATVQIGLRLSNVQDMPRMTNRDAMESDNVYALDCPDKHEPTAAYRPSPLVNTDSAESVAPMSRPQSPTDVPDSGARQNVPAPASSQANNNEVLLNPTVYDPNSPTKAKVPSPKGVGFSLPRRVNTTPVQNTAAVPPPPRNRGNSTTEGGKADWI